MVNIKYTIGSLFNIEKVKGKPLKEYVSEADGNNLDYYYITGSVSDNGIIGRVNKNTNKNCITNRNCIVVDPIKGLCFYYIKDFVGRGFSGASINVLRHNRLTEKSALYIIPAIKKVSEAEASYSKLFNGNRLKNAVIELPSRHPANWNKLEILVGGVLI